MTCDGFEWVSDDVVWQSNPDSKSRVSEGPEPHGGQMAIWCREERV